MLIYNLYHYHCLCTFEHYPDTPVFAIYVDQTLIILVKPLRSTALVVPIIAVVKQIHHRDVQTSGNKLFRYITKVQLLTLSDIIFADS